MSSYEDLQIYATTLANEGYYDLALKLQGREVVINDMIHSLQQKVLCKDKDIKRLIKVLSMVLSAMDSGDTDREITAYNIACGLLNDIDARQ